jgi:N-acetylglucosamine-6-phosphate deacetylase
VTTDITCDQFFDGDVLHGPRRVVIDGDGTVVSIQPSSGPSDVAVLSPGFVDVQMNGFRDVNVAGASVADLQRLDDYLIGYGTTSWLGTIVTAPLASLTAAINSLQETYESKLVPGFRGIHIEGPFLGSAPGAHQTKHIIACDLDWILHLPESVRLMTVAPEQVDVLNAIQLLVAKGITVSLGHSRPTRQQFDDSIARGAHMVTHLYNGMSGVHHRDQGLALWALTHSSIAMGLIVDLVHVQPDAVTLAFQAAASRVCLVSDSVAWMRPSGTLFDIEVRDGAPRLSDGTLAGSSTPLGVCVQNAVLHCGVSLISALASATSIPADLVKMTSVGRIRIGQKADLVALDSDLSVLKAWRRLPS